MGADSVLGSVIPFSRPSLSNQPATTESEYSSRGLESTLSCRSRMTVSHGQKTRLHPDTDVYQYLSIASK